MGYSAVERVAVAGRDLDDAQGGVAQDAEAHDVARGALPERRGRAPRSEDTDTAVHREHEVAAREAGAVGGPSGTTPVSTTPPSCPADRSRSRRAGCPAAGRAPDRASPARGTARPGWRGCSGRTAARPSETMPMSCAVAVEQRRAREPRVDRGGHDRAIQHVLPERLERADRRHVAAGRAPCASRVASQVSRNTGRPGRDSAPAQPRRTQRGLQRASASPVS